MNWIEFFQSEPWPSLVKALLHSLWQGALIATILYVLLRRLSAARTNLRYVLCLVAMAVVLLSTFATWAALDWHPTVSTDTTLIAEPVPKFHEIHQINSSVPLSPSSPRPRINWVAFAAVAWTLGTVLMFVRIVFAVGGVQRIRRTARPVDDETFARLWAELRSRMGIVRDIRVAISDRLASPAVIGVLWPTLLLPVSFLSNIQPELLQAILTHELAHIRRHDYLLNLLQMLVEALFFFNPAIWWISRQVRIEREACCDAIAVAATGGAADYAGLIAGYAQSVRGKIAAAPAFAGNPSGGTFIERIRRVLSPEKSPVVHAPWRTLCTTALAWVLVLLALWYGSHSAAALAAKILSHHERVQEITAIREESKTYDINNGIPTAVQVEATGTVRTEDGAPIPEGVKVIAFCDVNGGGYSMVLNIKNGRLFGKVSAGQVGLRVVAPGYAPAYAGPVMVGEEGSFDFGEIVLKKGFEGKIQFLDEDGRPIPNVPVIGGIPMVPDGHTMGINCSADENGVLALANCCDRPYYFNVRMPGYQYDRKYPTFVPDKPLPWVLKRAVPVFGRVVRDEDGTPIEGATLRWIYCDGRLSMQEFVDYADVVAVSDENGRFALDWLADDTTNCFAVEAPDREIVLLRDVKPGDAETIVKLGPQIIVSGTVVGPLDGLQVKDGKPQLLFHREIRFTRRYAHRDLNYVAIEERDGERCFEMTRLFKGMLEIEAGRKTVRLDVQKSISDLVIDLTDLAADYPKRSVLVRIKTPPDVPPLEGNLEFECTSHNSDFSFTGQMEFHQGEAHPTLPVPCNLSPNLDVSGYWFGKGRVSYWIPDQPVGEYLLEIEARPAGMIHGIIRDSHGNALLHAGVNAIVTKSPFGMNEPPWLKPLYNSAKSDYTINAPLGVESIVYAQSGWRFAASREIVLSENTPLIHQDFIMPEGVTVRGQVLSPDGNPVPDAEIRLRYDIRDGESVVCRGEMAKTDADGRFVMEHVNPDAPFDAYIMVGPPRDFRGALFRLKSPEKPVTIRLKKGEVLTGRVVFKDTGEPLGGFQVFAFAGKNSGSAFSERLNADTVTDAEGRFRFSNLEPVEYQFNIMNQAIDGVPKARGGDPKPITLRVLRQ